MSAIHPRDLRTALTHNRQVFTATSSPAVTLRPGHYAAPHDGEKIDADVIPTAMAAAIITDDRGERVTSCTLLLQAPTVEQLRKSVYHYNKRIAGKPARFFYQDLWRETYGRTPDSFRIASYFLGRVHWRDVRGLDPDLLMTDEQLPADVTESARRSIDTYRNRALVAMADVLEPTPGEEQLDRWVSKAALDPVDPDELRGVVYPGREPSDPPFWDDILDTDGMRTAQGYIEAAAVAGI